MIIFKQFTIGEIQYNLSLTTYANIDSMSPFRAYLRVCSDDNREFILRILKKRFKVSTYWQICLPKQEGRHKLKITSVDDEHKAQEARRQLLNFITNSL